MSDIHYNCPQRKGFAQSQEATFRRRLRDTVRKSSLTRAEKDITLAFLNHWFVHRHKGPVHPGRKKLAKRAKTAIRTVNRTLALLRDFDAIQAVSFEAGNSAEGFGMATEYTCDTRNLTVLCQLPAKALKQWRKRNTSRNIGVTNVPGSGGDKMSPRNNSAQIVYLRNQRGGE